MKVLALLAPFIILPVTQGCMGEPRPNAALTAADKKENVAHSDDGKKTSADSRVLELTCDTAKSTAETFIVHADRIRIPRSEFIRVSDFGSLKSINIYKAIIEDGSLQNIVTLPFLQTVTLSESEITTSEFSQFMHLKHLVKVSFRGTPLPPDAGQVIATIPNLQFVDITRTGLLPQDVEIIKLAK